MLAWCSGMVQKGGAEEVPPFVPLSRDRVCPRFLPTHADSAQAELQTASQRVPLMDPDFVPKPTLSPGESVDSVVAHEVKEIGVHMYVCVVSLRQ